MKKYAICFLAMVLLLAYGCKKEESFEIGNTPSVGTLQSDASGDCLPKTVNGIYVATTPLVPATNTITISVNVTQTGTYVIGTDTVNGYFFRATGTFTTLGANTVTLRSNGTPFTNGIDNFIVTYNGTICDIAITVLPAGSGGPAVFTLVSGGTPVNCASAVVNGTYVTGTPLNASNFVNVQVNVTQIGTYTISATGGGMTFARTTAAFTATGVQTVRLDGSGTPTGPAGPVTVTMAAPFGSCSFTVQVTGQAVYTINCPGVTVQGTYRVGVALTSANTITIPVTAVTSPGGYSITGTINGMTFTGSGNLTAPGNIILTGTGTPATGASPTSNLVLTSPSCTIPITVAPATAGPAVYTINCPGVTVQGTYRVGVALVASNTITIPVTAVSSPGTYSITGTINGMTFSGSGNLTGPGNIILNGSGTPTGAASPTSNLVLTSPSCTIPITVAAAAGPATFTINCGGATVQGTYTVGMALTAANTITIPVATITTPGSYNITTTAVNGMTFTGTGNLTATPANIVLTGSGTPTVGAAPTSNIVLPAPFASCTVPVTVGTVAVIDWSFNIGATTYSGSQTSSTYDITSAPPYTLIDFGGSYNAMPDLFYMGLGDPVGPAMNAGETYRTDVTALGINVGYFYFDNLPGMELEAGDPVDTPGANVTFTITSHNTVTKTIIGTFTGIAFDHVSTSTRTITNGSFKIVYP